MGFFKTWLLKRKEKQDLSASEEHDEQDLYLVRPDQVNMEDAREREKYVTSLLELIADASGQAKNAQDEYKTVDRYLKDMEELDYLKPEDKKHLLELAKAIGHLETDKTSYEKKGNHLSEEQFEKAQRLESEADEGMSKLREAEEYQQIIRDDLKRLEAEKHACMYRQHEADTMLENLRGMVQIATIAVVMCFVVLLIMQFGFHMNANIGFILVAAVFALALILMFLSYMDAQKESKSMGRSLSKIILLQNKVKIRYVNNTNLLEYLYLKYNISSLKEMETLFTRYEAEKEERAKMVETVRDLEEKQREMVDLLHKYKLYDPVIWIHQTQALLHPKEMVEVRHALILRRQKLRKQIAFNTKNSDEAKQQIKELVGLYPQYAKEVLKMVSDYEQAYPSL